MVPMLDVRSLVAAALAVGAAVAGAAVAAAPSCTLVRIDEWPVRVVRGHLIVDGTANGKPIGVMLDTGAQTSMILRSAAKRLQLPIREAKNYRMFGIGGETYAQMAQVDELRIRDVPRKGWNLLVAGERDFGEGIEMILGDDFFSLADVEFDLAHGAVRLFQPKDCDSASLAYWTKGTPGVVAMERVVAAQPQIILTLQVNGVPLAAMLDSGASISMLTKRDAEAAGVTPETPGVIAGAEVGGLGATSIRSWIGPFQTVAIGNETIRDTMMHFADLYRAGAHRARGSLLSRAYDDLQPSILGIDFLLSHRVLVAHSQRKLYFTPTGDPVFRTRVAPASGNAPNPAAAPKPGAAPN